MNIANNCSADEVSVRLCFLVSVRKARGRRAAGGSSIGNTDGLEISVGFGTWLGCIGVLKAGEDDETTL